jgi:L-ascorbate metabolism protein UlaG (beta-lactamase superfamily)
MLISKYIHSCLLLEKNSQKILFDPGKFSFVEGLVKPQQFQGLSAIIVTHWHPDHVNEEALTKIISNNPDVEVFGNRETHARLAEKGIDSTIFESGSRTLGSFEVSAFHAPHAPILGEAPPQNTAYVLDGMLLNPGDSFANSLYEISRISLLALPIMAPWNTELEVAEFARRISPREIIPIHDGYAKDFFLQQRYETFTEHFSSQGMKFHALYKPGDSIELRAKQEAA